MFVAFFSLTRLLRNNALFYYLESENQIKFLLISYFLGLNNYRKLTKKLVRNRRKVLLLKAEKHILGVGKSLLTNFLYGILHENLEKKKESNRQSLLIKTKC